MVQEFTKNVERLFAEIVTDKSQECAHSADELLAVLQRKVTLPVGIIDNNRLLRLVYDNVTIDLQHNLSGMQIVYNSDYQMTLKDLYCCDVRQLSEFVLSLERDIPKWRHIWVVENKVSKMRVRMQDRVKSIFSEMRTVWKNSPYPIKDNLIQQYRLRYYNLKACQLMLDIGNPYWENKTTEQDILEECRLYHINVPIESWCEEYDEFQNLLSKLRDEKERRLEEQKRQQEKERHLIRLKQQKLQAFIKAIEFHPGFSVEVRPNIYDSIMASVFTRYTIFFKINNNAVSCIVSYNDIDKFIPKMIDAIKRINDIIPDLNSTYKGRKLFYHAVKNPFAVQIRNIINELKKSA